MVAIGNMRNILASTMMLLPLFSQILTAQNTTEKNSLNLTLESEASVGDGDFSPYYLVSNRHGLLDRNSNTGYLRIQLEGDKRNGDWKTEGMVDLQASVHARSAVYLHQCYVATSWRWAQLMIGAREQQPYLRDFRLSSGNLVWSGNARPIPEIRLGIDDFITVPHTHDMLQVKLDASYGRCLDDDYLEDEYALYCQDKTGYGRSWITKGVWLHQKRMALRTNPQKPWVLTISGEHVVQFGGQIRSALVPELADASFSPKLSDFLRALLPISGGDNSAEGDQNFNYGNHVGEMSILLERQWGARQQHRVGFYLENPFEDGSGIRKGNGMDGLWGIEYHNRERNALINGIVLEYLQTTDQSGPIHWAPTDFAGQEVSTSMPKAATGQDDYYNNYFYTGYSHYGMCIGTPMLKSPAFNADHYLRFTDNRVRAWHLGIEGAYSALSYRLLASYRQSWGTYFYPNPEVYDSTNALMELSWRHRKWQFTAGYAFDQGELYGSNHALSLRINYQISLL